MYNYDLLITCVGNVVHWKMAMGRSMLSKGIYIFMHMYIDSHSLAFKNPYLLIKVSLSQNIGY